ncbi:hypothetical protein BaRGS_00036577 [Batillaria attramentaria]|uniref:Uncharacterized protein n=1 Tax=Batillaria attramentaria TaxID=370345 RepID=A0ABD0JBE4_9CAEN
MIRQDGPRSQSVPRVLKFDYKDQTEGLVIAGLQPNLNPCPQPHPGATLRRWVGEGDGGAHLSYDRSIFPQTRTEDRQSVLVCLITRRVTLGQGSEGG